MVCVMASSTDNPFEMRGRFEKAWALARQAKSEELDRIDLEGLLESEWCELAERASVNPPSEKTRRAVLALMPSEGEAA